MAAIIRWLELYPNPDGLPTVLILDPHKMCVKENPCQFLGIYFCPNSGTATGPPHACDFADIFMGELDKVVVDGLVDREVENTGWTLYRDDAWMVLLDGLNDVPAVENLLQGLHPNIKWEFNPRGPSVPPHISPDGTIVDRSVLEHLDLTIHIIEGSLETDVFAKDIPIYISKKSCHPPIVFSAVAQSVAVRLRTNCSLDRFLTPRIEEYTNYLLASDYSREEVGEVMERAKNMDRNNMINGNRNNRRRTQKKYVLCSKWDPRQPNVREGLKLFEEVLYLSEENIKAFPKGSIIAGFRRQKNLLLI